MFRLVHDLLKENRKIQEDLKDVRDRTKHVERQIYEIKASVALQRQIPAQSLSGTSFWGRVSQISNVSGRQKMATKALASTDSPFKGIFL
jgi:hypothetical protein